MVNKSRDARNFRFFYYYLIILMNYGIQSVSDKMKNKTNMEFRGAMRYSPRMFLIFGLLGYLATGEFMYIRLFIYVFLTEVIVYTLKQFTKDKFSNVLSNDIIYRPKNSGDCMGCGSIFYCENNCVVSDTQVGMPSGHTAVAFMFATFFISKIWTSPGFLLFKIARTVALVLIAIMVGMSRVYLENCHTVSQVIAGSVVGMTLGLLFSFIDNLFRKN